MLGDRQQNVITKHTNIKIYLIHYLNKRTVLNPSSLRIHVDGPESLLSACRRFESLTTQECPAKTLIRLRGCAVWSESSRGAHVILKELLCPGSYSVYRQKAALYASRVFSIHLFADKYVEIGSLSLRQYSRFMALTVCKRYLLPGHMWLKL